jgi:hypothetical protein
VSCKKKGIILTTKQDTFMQKTKRIYQDTRTQNNLSKLNDDLQDVTRIMTKNMEDLLWRGDSLDRKFSFHHFIPFYTILY